VLADTCCNFELAISKTRWSSAVGATDVLAPKRVASQLPDSCRRVSIGICIGNALKNFKNKKMFSVKKILLKYYIFHSILMLSRLR
jgi:hypothetical protein